MTDRPLGLRELDDLDVVFSALAHRSRRQILTVLRVRDGTMTAGELASRFECSWPTTTRHLTILTDAGLIAVEQRGRERHYTILGAPMRDVAGRWLDRFES